MTFSGYRVAVLAAIHASRWANSEYVARVLGGGVFPRLVVMLADDEGVVQNPYEDTTGHLTAGIGHRLSGRDSPSSAVPVQKAAQWFTEDLSTALDGLYRTLSTETFQSLMRTPRMAALASMAFNLGVDGLRGFSDTLRAVEGGDWRKAGAHAVDSVWAGHPADEHGAVGPRAWRTAYILRTNRWWRE